MLEVIEKEIVKPILIKDLGFLYPTLSSNKKRHYGIFKCGFCGTEFRTQINNVKNGNTKSCGCYTKKHGLIETRLYRIWAGIKDRTLNIKTRQFPDYGDRGITICDEWKNDFMSFYNWAIPKGYSEELSIDRIDNDGNYEPNNCRWTTRVIQNRNQRLYKNNSSGYKGVTYIKANKKFKAQIKVNNNNIYLGSFLTAVEGAIAYNNYIIENNLEGFILNEIIWRKI